MCFTLTLFFSFLNVLLVIVVKLKLAPFKIPQLGKTLKKAIAELHTFKASCW